MRIFFMLILWSVIWAILSLMGLPQDLSFIQWLVVVSTYIFYREVANYIEDNVA